MSAQVLFATVSAVDEHDTGGGHPERFERLNSAADGIAEAMLHDAVVAEFNGRQASFDELALVHDGQYLDALEGFMNAGGGDLDPDTPTVGGSWSTALHAVGTGLVAIESLRRGEGSAAFVAVRPPGHHATASRAMGFCLLNNVAIGAASLAASGERVLIVDWDVHHGNGTQEIFWDDPRVLYVSTHQWPAYPGSGRASETGGAGAPGLTVNVPLPPGSSGDAALAAMDEIAAPVIARFDPTWVLISAGFDAHRDDPLADLVWSAGDFAALTAKVASFAPQQGRVVAYLEGGYDLPALARSVGATVAALAGESWMPEPLTCGGPGREAVAVAARLRERKLGGGER
ncbi:MAG TPA: histone deacetylase [Acidimicrobiales bacterium]|nr:histone deacetylase [Acidimicrobiales bacterium]